MGGSVACETKSVESIIDRREVRTLVAELQKAKTCEVYRVDDSGQIVSLVLAYPGHDRAASYVADPHQVYETWQRVETASGSLVM